MSDNNKVYPCKDCKLAFETAEDFSDHFQREKGHDSNPKGGVIVGCKPSKEKVDG